MKSQHTSAALLDLRRAAGCEVPVVSAQNGVANEDAASRLFARVYALAVYLPATMLSPGEVLLHGTPLQGALEGGRYPSGTDPLIGAICADLAAAGFISEPRADVMALKYGKLLLNLGNAVQALCGLEAAAGELIAALRDEALACYAAAGIEYVDPKQLRRQYNDRYRLGEIAGGQRQGGSTWQSLMRGADSVETDYLNGEICLLGARHGVATPYNRAVQRLAAEHVQRGGGPGAVTVETIVTLAERLAAIG
jgi:2-dehydropantoate 2-reductase